MTSITNIIQPSLDQIIRDGVYDSLIQDYDRLKLEFARDKTFQNILSRLKI